MKRAPPTKETIISELKFRDDEAALLLRDKKNTLHVAIVRAGNRKELDREPVSSDIGDAIKALSRRRDAAIEASKPPPKIRRLLKIVDTREREERDGMYSSYSVPIRGTGDIHVCARCGAEHEVHAYVELEDGSQAILGTGCARQAAMDAGDKDMARFVSSMDRRAKRRAELLANVDRFRRLSAERAKALREVASQTPPPVVWKITGKREIGGRDMWRVFCGDESVYSLYGPEMTPDEADAARYYDVGDAQRRIREREDHARRAWVDRRIEELGYGHTPEHKTADHYLKAAEQELAKFDAATQKMLHSG